jgi:hypothetical protein
MPFLTHEVEDVKEWLWSTSMDSSSQEPAFTRAPLGSRYSAMVIKYKDKEWNYMHELCKRVFNPFSTFKSKHEELIRDRTAATSGISREVLKDLHLINAMTDSLLADLDDKDAPKGDDELEQHNDDDPCIDDDNGD